MRQKKLLLIFGLFICSFVYAKDLRGSDANSHHLFKGFVDERYNQIYIDTTFITVDVRFEVKLWQDTTNNRWAFIVLDKDKELGYFSGTLPATFNIANGFATKVDDEKVARLVVNKIYTSQVPWILKQEDLDGISVTL